MPGILVQQKSNMLQYFQNWLELFRASDLGLRQNKPCIRFLGAPNLSGRLSIHYNAELLRKRSRSFLLKLDGSIWCLRQLRFPNLTEWSALPKKSVFLFRVHSQSQIEPLLLLQKNNVSIGHEKHIHGPSKSNFALRLKEATRVWTSSTKPVLLVSYSTSITGSLQWLWNGEVNTELKLHSSWLVW